MVQLSEFFGMQLDLLYSMITNHAKWSRYFDGEQVQSLPAAAVLFAHCSLCLLCFSELACVSAVLCRGGCILFQIQVQCMCKLALSLWMVSRCNLRLLCSAQCSLCLRCFALLNVVCLPAVLCLLWFAKDTRTAPGAVRVSQQHHICTKG
jgi:hypothetical protein